MNTSASLANAVYTNKTPVGFKKNKKLSDRRSKVYENEETGELYIAYRGTDPSNKSDLFADVAIAGDFKEYHPRFHEAEKKLNRVKKYYGKRREEPLRIHAVGHSLGGALTRYVAERNDIESATVFNEGSNALYDLKKELDLGKPYDPLDPGKKERDPTMLERVGLAKPKSNTQITHYTTRSDPISMGSYVPRRNTTVEYVARKDGLDPHTMMNFLPDEPAPVQVENYEIA